jgi:hypothetical protein
MGSSTFRCEVDEETKEEAEKDGEIVKEAIFLGNNFSTDLRSSIFAPQQAGLRLLKKAAVLPMLKMVIASSP